MGPGGGTEGIRGFYRQARGAEREKLACLLEPSRAAPSNKKRPAAGTAGRRAL